MHDPSGGGWPTALPTEDAMRKRQQQEHQGSRRIGPPILPPRKSLLTDVRGFFLPVAFYWWLAVFAGAVVEFGAMIYDMSCADCAYRGHGDGGSF